MLKRILFLLFSAVSILADAQSPLKKIEQLKTLDQKIDTLKAYVLSASGERDFNTMLDYCARGIVISGDRKSDAAYFYYFRGYAFQEQKAYDSAISNTIQAMNLYIKDNNLKSEVYTMRRLHYIYYYAGRGDERIPMMKKALEIIDTTKNNEAKSSLIGMLSEYYYDQGLYEKAIEFKLKYITLQKNEDQSSDYVVNEIAVTNSQIGETYLTMKQPAKAIEYFTEASKYYKNHYHGKAMNTNNFITAFTNLNQPDSALLYYNKLYQLLNPDDSLPEILSIANGSLSKYYLGKNNIPQALLYATKEFNLSVKSKEPIALMGSHLTLANLYVKTKDYQNALNHLTIAENNSYAFGREGVAAIRYLQAQTYAGLGNWQQAYLKYDAYTILHDSIVTESSTKNIADAEAKFQNKEKQQQIENKNLQLTAEKKQRYWLLSALVLLGLIAVLLIRNYSTKKKAADVLESKNKKLAVLNSQLEEANTTKAKLFSIIGHDLRSPINQVYQYLKLQQLNPGALSDSQKNELSNKIQNATGSLLETMEDLLLWSKTQMSEFKVNMQQVSVIDTVVACQNLLQLNIDAKHIRFKNLVPENTIVITDPYYLQTIIRNLLQNAVKASPENGAIEVGLEKRDSSYVIFIKNEGGYFSQEQYQQLIKSNENTKGLHGLGLRLADELSQKIDAAVSFKNNGGQTTQAEILLKHR